ncbi:MAG: tetratricopeptide repeat protein [Kiritimatiellia bacterium]
MMGRTDEGLSSPAGSSNCTRARSGATNVLYWIGEVRFNQGDFSGAEEMFRRLIRGAYDEPPPPTMFWAGRAAAAQKQYLRAMETFSRFFDRYPDSPRVPDALF